MSKQRPRRSMSQWQKVISNQETTGESVSVYCRKKDLCQKSFYTWRRRLRKENKFIEVIPPKISPIIQYQIRITSPQGYLIEVPAGIDISSIKNVMKTIG